MAIYLPPITRKKAVPGKYNPDSFRVISQDAENDKLTWRDSSVNVLANQDELRKQRHTPYIYCRETQVLPKSMPDYRANKPHPEATDFLRCNVFMLNEPICSVHTEESQSSQSNWWPSGRSEVPQNTPPFTLNTTFRDDFRQRKPQVPGATRHSSNPNTEPSRGVAPVNSLRGLDGKQTLWKEGLSYEHQYNCRQDPSYPIRAKRHGAFVWDKMSLTDSQKFIDHYSRLAEEENSSRNQSNSREVTCAGTDYNVNWPSEPLIRDDQAREIINGQMTNQYPTTSTDNVQVKTENQV